MPWLVKKIHTNLPSPSVNKICMGHINPFRKACMKSPQDTWLERDFFEADLYTMQGDLPCEG